MTIISDLSGDKENAMASVLLLIHCHWKECYADDSGTETWIVTEAGKALLKKAQDIA